MSRVERKTIIEERIKSVQQLKKELDKNQTAQCNLGYIILDKPIRDGWYRTLKLREDILKSKHAKVYQEVLDAVKVEIWGRDKKHADKNWSNYFRRTSFRFCRYPRQGIQCLGEKAFAKLSHKAKKEFRTFNKSFFFQKQSGYYCTLPDYFFQTDYRRAYITKIKIRSPELESREQEIEELLNSSELWKYSMRSYGKYRLWYNSNKRNRRKINMELSKVQLGVDQFF